jgi:Fe-S-cluster-containing hydrogenase component 2
VCPVDAITISEDRIEFDENLCIYCHACVKNCPQKAITIDDERIIGFSKSLQEKCKNPREQEIFLSETE